MTLLPDHRSDHAPDRECESCRTPEAGAGLDPSRAQARGVAGPRPDLVIEPGTNRK